MKIALLILLASIRTAAYGENFAEKKIFLNDQLKASDGNGIGDVGNGGGDVLGTFFDASDEVLAFLETHPFGRTLVAQIEKRWSVLLKRFGGSLVTAIRSQLTIDRIYVDSSTEPVLDNKGSDADAIFENGRLRLVRYRWQDHFKPELEKRKYYLVFHELLRLVRIPDDKYTYSNKIRPFFSKSKDDEIKIVSEKDLEEAYEKLFVSARGEGEEFERFEKLAAAATAEVLDQFLYPEGEVPRHLDVFRKLDSASVKLSVRNKMDIIISILKSGANPNVTFTEKYWNGSPAKTDIFDALTTDFFNNPEPRPYGSGENAYWTSAPGIPYSTSYSRSQRNYCYSLDYMVDLLLNYGWNPQLKDSQNKKENYLLFYNFASSPPFDLLRSRTILRLVREGAYLGPSEWGITVMDQMILNCSKSYLPETCAILAACVESRGGLATDASKKYSASWKKRSNTNTDPCADDVSLAE